MFSEVTFGQYYPSNSCVHKLDARVKIILLIAYLVMIFVVKNFYGFLTAILFLCFVIALSKVPLFSVLKSVNGIIFLVVFTAILNVLFYSSNESAKVYFKLGIICVSNQSITFAVFMSLRLTLLVLGSSLLTLTTTPVSLTDAIESLLYPLKLIKFPVHELALIMSIALRFISSLMIETDRIMCAQKARGADFETGSIFSRVKALVPILIPLIASSIRRAEELGDAMDSRCYSGSKGRTRYKQLKVGLNDLYATFFMIFIFLVVIYFNRYMVGII